MSKRPTIRDVANAAKVSTATVSQILRHGGNELISEKTVKRVREIAKQLGYRPNLLASGLGSGKSNIIGVISSRIDIRIMVRKIEAAEQVFSSRGYAVIVLDARGQEELEAEYVSFLARGLLDGILIASDTSPLLRSEIKALADRGHPIVTIEPIDGVEIDCVTVDRVLGAYKAVSHLLSLGHERIAFLSGDPIKRAIRDRYTGYEKAFRERGLGVDPELVVAIAAKNPCEEGYEAAREALKLAPPATALFCLSDDVAIGAMAYVRESGKRVPEDVAVVGFDDIQVGRYAATPLTTVSQPAEDVGKQAAKLLLDQIDGKEKRKRPRQIVIEPDLVIRCSCGAESTTHKEA
ncbi:MAG: LacI family transcriptional regulator [Planctomycetes bacterium]|nr:LacI family transcriptional regulator [Planctomycetota bacterium]